MSQTKATTVPPSVQGSSQRALPGYTRFRKTIDFGNASTNCFDFENSIKAIAVATVGPQQDTIEAMPVFLIDPCQNGSQPIRTATIVSSTIGDGAAFLTVITSKFQSRDSITAGAANVNTAPPLWDLSNYGFQGTSATNTALVAAFDTKGLNEVLAIVASASAGTFTLKLEASHDNFATQTILIDLFAAAGSFAKNYINSTVGTTGAGFTAVSPIAFRFLKVTAGAAGVGNTVTMSIAMK